MTNMEEIKALVARYVANRDEYTRNQSTYTELDLRAEYLDPFFAALGWDLNNSGGRANRLREVVRETRVNVDENVKRPDYEFRLGAERKFFVEAKKPSVKLITDPKPAFQVRRYGWSAGLMISVLSNFEDLIVYDTTTEPNEAHSAENSRLFRFHYTEYEARIDEITNLLSKQSVYSGDFDERFSSATENRPSEKIDAVFLEQLNEWRVAIASDLYVADTLTPESYLNEISQRLILRILFLRMCEDRGIQTYEHLRRVALTNDWDTFTNFLIECDERYDSGLFDTSADPFVSGSNRLRITPSLILKIIESLYYPTAPYTFSVIEPEFLGSIYEQFLTERIFIVGERVKLLIKPEHNDRDVVSTPRSIIEKIVERTLAPALESLTSEEILGKRLIDPAVGSGGFLISAFDYLADLLVRKYLQEGRSEFIYETANGYQLTFQEKSNILTASLYGVDRDYLAIEVARFSLLVKLLENETAGSLPEHESILPALSDNIVFGDSLIDERIVEEDPESVTIGIPVAWGDDLPAKYDFVIGNPPYLKTEDMLNLEPVEHRFYVRHYKTAYKQFDKYYLFLERIIRDLLTDDGRVGMIISRKFSHIESGKKLREFISESGLAINIFDFGNAQLFGGRSTYTCLLFLSPVENEEENFIPYELVTSPREWIKKQTNHTPAMRLPRALISGEAPWILPNTPEELRLLEALLTNTVPLGQIMDVFNGIQTSRNDVYVIKEWKEVNENLISFVKDKTEWRVEKGILKNFFEGSRNISGELKSFYRLPSSVKIIFPYDILEEDGFLSATTIPPDRFREDYPGAWAWLSHNKESLSKRDIRPADYPAEEWYRYGRDQALTSFENRPKIVVGVNSKGDKYVYDETDTLIASGGTAGECAVSYFTNPERQFGYDLYFILAVLNHKAIEYFCRKRGSPFRGGWYARGTAVLKDIPIPRIDFAAEGNRLTLYQEVVLLSKELCRDYPALLTAAGSAHDRSARAVAQKKRVMDGKISELYNVSNIIALVNLPE